MRDRLRAQERDQFQRVAERLGMDPNDMVATELRTRALEACSDVMYENVMSYPSKIAELQRAIAAGMATIEPAPPGGT